MEFGSLKLTDKGWDVLKGDLKIWGQLEQQPPSAQPARDTNRIDDLDYDQELFEILRKTRKELANQSGVPPFVIFADKTLVEMATYFPQSSESLLDIYGVGAVKCKKFGPLFQEIIGKYCREHQIEERPQRSLVIVKNGY
jgi:ATP-dependent DNA helicase RecQ